MTTATPPLDSSSADVPPQGPPRLRRSATDRMAGGVCGGLGEYTGVDPVLWRVGFVALTLLGGSGVLFYALLWVLVPAAPGADRSPLDQLATRLGDAVTAAVRRLQGR